MIKDTKMTRMDIFFLAFDQIVTLRFKTSKSDVNHTRVFLFIEVKYKQNCSLTIFCKLFFKDLKRGDLPLFSQVKRVFSHKYQVDKMQSRFLASKIDIKTYLSCSFLQSKAKHASKCGMLHKSISMYVLWKFVKPKY